MKIDKIDKKQVIALLTDIVAEHGEDYIYPDPVCSYLDDEDHPSCIVGHVLARLDLLDLQVVQDNGEAGELAETGLFTAPAVRALRVAQCAQDGVTARTRETWGKALRKAKVAR